MDIQERMFSDIAVIPFFFLMICAKLYNLFLLSQDSYFTIRILQSLYILG
jgi:hypothetical protein